MIRLGRVYRGIMVDVQATNKKLEKRKREMLVHLTGKPASDAEAALQRADGNVKLAVLLLQGCDLETARAVLDETCGQLRPAVERVQRKPAAE
jgi:N-acetylmuramic acid 6-phosphate etherase